MDLLQLLKRNFFYKMHPDTALRYLPIVEYLVKNHLDKLSILEVGSGSYGITPYLKRAIDGVDVEFDEGNYPLLNQIKGSATNLPMKNSSYDIVLLSDVLEHIPPKFRKKCFDECIRVAKKMVLISGPFGQDAFYQDQELAAYSKNKVGRVHRFFDEHIENGLPEVEDILFSVKGNMKVRQIQVLGHFLNLKAREMLMKIYITNNKLQYYFYLKGMMFLVPVFLLLNRRPCYRTLISIDINND